MNEYTEGAIAGLLMIIPILLSLSFLPKSTILLVPFLIVLGITLIIVFVVGLLYNECIGPFYDYWKKESKKEKKKEVET